MPEETAEVNDLPIAMIQGQPFNELPRDLYIPPEALQIFLESFEGPLDLLLYLIKRQNIDILDINVFTITHQYVQYVEMMEAIDFELAAEYLVMAAMLTEIKSRMLLPRTETVADEEEDPRAALIRRLQQYERFKKASEDIDAMPRLERDFHIVKIEPPALEAEKQFAEVTMDELMSAFSDILKRAEMFGNHQVEQEKLSTRQRMTEVLDRLQEVRYVPFVSLFVVGEGRLGIVVTFLAIMELVKELLIEIVQTESFGPIHVKAKAS